MELIDPTDGSLVCSVMYEDSDKPIHVTTTSFNHTIFGGAVGQVKTDGFKGIDTSQGFIHFGNICTNQKYRG